MTKIPHDLAERFVRDGYYAPVPAISPEHAQALGADLDRLEAEHGPDVWKRTKLKPHLLIKSINELVREPRILDAVEQALGPDLMVWGVGLFKKPARDPGFYAWHQDATYWGLTEPALATAWIALTPSNRDNGCLRIVPRSHTQARIAHREVTGTDNLLSRGQEVAVEVDERDAVDLVLEPGQMSLHHVMIVHGSEPNRSGQSRIGIGIRYISARIAPADGFEDSATLVRGRDYGHFVLEPQPKEDFDPVCIALYDRIVVQSRARAESEAKALDGM